MLTGRIFDISRFRIHDGPGVRTAVFLKGCPLRCKWCHNPESFSKELQIAFYSQKCVSCGRCAAVCPQNCHTFDKEGKRIFDRTNCIACGKCVKVCGYKALEQMGRTVTVDEVLDEVMKDSAYYSQSGGGLTITGGEPLFQPDFSIALAKEAKERGLHVCVETSGWGEGKKLKELADYVDLFLYDIKVKPEYHKEWIGHDCKKITDNLQILKELNAAIDLRCPIISRVNDSLEHMDYIAEIIAGTHNIKSVTLEPYQPLGIDKRKALDMLAEYDNSEFCNNEAIERLKEYLHAKVNIPVNSIK